MGRAPCCEKVGLKKGRWTAEEDQTLINYIHTNGEGSWRSLPKNAGLLRCGKSCRLRWINYLRADLKRGNITTQEEDIIIKLHASMGNRWSLIASQLPGRTDNEIKNYWNSHLSRKIDTFRRPINMMHNIPAAAGAATSSSSSTTVAADADVQMNTARKSNCKRRGRGGRTSRWAMKKNKITYASATAVNRHLDCDHDHVGSPKTLTGTSSSSIKLCPHPPPPPSAAAVAAGNNGQKETQSALGEGGGGAEKNDDGGEVAFNDLMMMDMVVNDETPVLDPSGGALTLSGEFQGQSDDGDVMGVIMDEDSSKLLCAPNNVMPTRTRTTAAASNHVDQIHFSSESNSNSKSSYGESSEEALFDGEDWPAAATCGGHHEINGTILDYEMRWDWESDFNRHDYLWSNNQKDDDDENMLSWLWEHQQVADDRSSDKLKSESSSTAVVDDIDCHVPAADKNNAILAWLLS